jgi:hypothetical protein
MKAGVPEPLPGIRLRVGHREARRRHPGRVQNTLARLPDRRSVKRDRPHSSENSCLDPERSAATRETTRVRPLRLSSTFRWRRQRIAAIRCIPEWLAITTQTADATRRGVPRRAWLEPSAASLAARGQGAGPLGATRMADPGARRKRGHEDGLRVHPRTYGTSPVAVAESAISASPAMPDPTIAFATGRRRSGRVPWRRRECPGCRRRTSASPRERSLACCATDGRFGDDAISRWRGVGADEDDRRHPGPVACSSTPALLQATEAVAQTLGRIQFLCICDKSAIPLQVISVAMRSIWPGDERTQGGPKSRL